MMETVGEITEHAVSALRARLRHVYWIGGGSGAGKSAIARRVADGRGPPCTGGALAGPWSRRWWLI